MKLKLESNTKALNQLFDIGDGVIADPNIRKAPDGSSVIVSPWSGPNNWLFRVMVSPKQAIIGFRKHMTIAIGFMNEAKDGNTNLPSRCLVNEIFKHIKVNQADASDADCLNAIRLIKIAAGKWERFQQARKDEKVMRMFPELRGPKGMMSLTEFRKACYVKQQKYAGDYNVVFGRNPEKQVWRYYFTLDSHKGLRRAIQKLYFFLKDVGEGGDIYKYRYYGIDGARFDYNRASLPNQWNSGILNLHGLEVIPMDAVAVEQSR